MSISSISNQKTIQEIIDSSSTPDGKDSRNTGELGKDQFITLLITQLQHQDPLNPVDDKEFVSQMAQFTSLEQMQNLNASFSANKAFSLLGKYVKATIEENDTERKVEGYAENVIIENNTAYVIVDDNKVSMESITDVSNSNTVNTSDISKYSNLIDKNVRGRVSGENTDKYVNVSGNVRSIEKNLDGEYAIIDGAQLQIVDVVTTLDVTNQEYLNNYLQQNVGNEIELEVKDGLTGSKIPVKGILQDFAVDENGIMWGRLDNLKMLIGDIEKIENS
ncbi:MAG: flagellar hook capping FlgD N-terminal domain-containing protein [Clostridiales bacterium]